MKHITVIVLLVFAASCTRESIYPGFSKGKHGVIFKLEKLGESNKKPRIGDYITADITYLTMADSVFFNGRRKLKLSHPKYRGAIEDCFMMLREDESATFIISADDFFQKTLESKTPEFIEPMSLMKVKMEIIEIQTHHEYNLEKQAFLNWINDFGEYEKVILTQYLKDAKLPVQPLNSGLYYLQIEAGKGKKIVKGDTITINYEGRFLNGKFFDSTVRRNQPFQFVYGTEWQVIKGLEEGLALMREGEKAIFILPSELAFGQSGSSTGIIPPFTSLIFEVEVLEVKSGKSNHSG